jgi:NitT/TauT family transport system substrate-binding protein
MSRSSRRGGWSRRRFLRAAAATAAVGPFVRPRGLYALDTVRLGMWSPRLAEQTNIYVCEERGFFKDEGIEMTWVPGVGSGAALRNVIAGNADIGFVGPEAIYFAADKGEKIKAVYNIYPQNCFNVFAFKRHKIARPADLAGKKVGVLSMESGTRYNLETLLAVNNIKRSDIEMIAVGLNPVPALQNDQIQAMAMTDSMLHTLQYRGLDPVDVIWCRDYLNLPSDVFAVLEKDFKPKRDLLKRFLRAYRKGTEWTIQHPEEAVPYGTKHAVDGKDPALVLGNIKIRIVGTSQSPTTKQKGLGWFDLSVLREGAAAYRKAALIKTDLDIETIFTNELVAEL